MIQAEKPILSMYVRVYLKYIDLCIHMYIHPQLKHSTCVSHDSRFKETWSGKNAPKHILPQNTAVIYCLPQVQTLFFHCPNSCWYQLNFNLSGSTVAFNSSKNSLLFYTKLGSENLVLLLFPQQKTHANTSAYFTVLQRVLHINTRNTAVVCHTSYPDVFFVTVPTFRIRPVVFFVVCDLSIGETRCLLNAIGAGARVVAATYIYALIIIFNI